MSKLPGAVARGARTASVLELFATKLDSKRSTSIRPSAVKRAVWAPRSWLSNWAPVATTRFSSSCRSMKAAVSVPSKAVVTSN